MAVWLGVTSVERDSSRNGAHTRRVRSALAGTSMLAAGGDVLGRVIQREWRWTSDAYKVYTRNYAYDARQVSRKLAAGKGLQRQPGQDTVCGKLYKSRSNLGCGGVNGVGPFSVSVVREFSQ